MAKLSQIYMPIILYEVPQDEQEEVNTMQAMLAFLESFVEDFSAAIELFDFWENNKSDAHRRWPFLAARDGAMTLYQFKITLGKMRASLKLAPSLLAQIDIDKLRLAENLFDASFPKTEKMRHAVAHNAEVSTKVLLREIEVHPEGAHAVTLYSLIDRRYVTDFGNEALSYEVTTASLEKLNSVKALFFSGFDSVNLFAKLA